MPLRDFLPRPAPPDLQLEYRALLNPARSWRTWLNSPRLYVLPTRAMRRAGGAAVSYRWTCIGPDVVAAPPDVRRALLAHEVGHVASGHGLAAIASIMLLGAFIASSSSALSLLVLCLLAALMAYLLHPAREYEADDVATTLVGTAALRRALEWAGAADAAVSRRLMRLGED